VTQSAGQVEASGSQKPVTADLEAPTRYPGTSALGAAGRPAGASNPEGRTGRPDVARQNSTEPAGAGARVSGPMDTGELDRGAPHPAGCPRSQSGSKPGLAISAIDGERAIIFLGGPFRVGGYLSASS
jgi:hypothetical protein